MSKKNVYFESSKYNNLNSNMLELDPTLAGPSDAKDSYIFRNASTRETLVGTMPINEDINQKLELNSTYIIPNGYHTGNSVIYTGPLSDYTQASNPALPEEVAMNKVFYVNGLRYIGTLDMSSLTQDGTATSSDIASEKTAWVNGDKIIGTIPDFRGETRDISLEAGEDYTIPYGIHSGTSRVTALNLESQTQGTAFPNDLVKNKIAWVNGEKIKGTLDITEEIVEQLKTTNAEASHVIDGKTFYSNVYKSIRTGTMPTYIGIPERELQPNQSIAVERGYHDGTGIIKAADIGSVTSGTATENDIRNEKTAWVNGRKIIGNIQDISTDPISLLCGQSYTIPKGYSTGELVISAQDLSSQTQGTAEAKEILNSKTAWVNGIKVTGTMQSRGAIVKTLNAGESVILQEGYHNGYGQISAKPLAPQTEGTANPADIIEDKTAWVGGSKITGTIHYVGSEFATIGAGETHVISKGYHDGNGVISASGIGPQTPGTATSGDILSPQTAWVNGKKLTGTLTLIGTAQASDVISGVTFYNTDAKSKITGTLLLTGNAQPDDVLEGMRYYKDDPKDLKTGTLALKGNARSGHVLSGETYYTVNPKAIQTGTMQNIGAVIKTLDPGESISIPEGYHNGNGLIYSKSLQDVTQGTATAADIREGLIAWVNGEKIVGTMKDADSMRF